MPGSRRRAIPAPARVARSVIEVHSKAAVGSALLAVIARPDWLTLRPVEQQLPPESCAKVRGVPDADAKNGCYQVGPVLLTGASVLAAQASRAADSGGTSWGIDVTVGKNVFRPIATGYVGSQIAIVVDGVVLSAPVINPGITGDIFRISGLFDATRARGLAAAFASRATLPVSFTVSHP